MLHYHKAERTAMFEHIRLDHVLAAGIGLTSGAATLLQVIPVILGSIASVVGIGWIFIQFYWARKDRKKQGK
jgi:hypothetical protein